MRQTKVQKFHIYNMHCIGPEESGWEYFIPGLLRAARILLNTGVNWIFHDIEYTSFEKVSVQKHAKNPIWKGSGSELNLSTSRHTA
jgi:hypothetical protein